ncbi:hypothetical protein [Shewanella algae]|uniref:hypothetical protein n=1 Tax=Shewanella algae TaxID=38313 RepID=UPI0011842D54|nr:hypothetical protein [Shewanella algae]MBO2646576.1 hypothetical protein [Shewanella algae]
MKPEIEKRYATDFLVLLEEEYGYRRWYWFPSMAPSELEDWWLRLESVDPYFMTPEPLPGDLYQVEDDDEFDLFVELEKTGKFYVAHTHCDDDSVLLKPDKTKLFHKGYEHG